jgi:pSer/pThr/pTyr-binding forkhead associated (FHA) protein
VIQLNILSGKMAGDSWVARRFPVRIGRSPNSDLRLEEDGVWEHHLVVSLDKNGFLLSVEPKALARVNGEPASETYLRNGDVVDAGSVSLRFWVSAVRQNGLGFREALTWVTIALVCLSQIAIIYRLLR